ncbi:unnamed protein product [Paramecium sonneborni]|uniref:Uncharacterized protein n=1 Tax=Paramecium sonneborni TaxID=65129 RepID=A0A8S1RR77_9CILI|nr:unnamed protein product [Paramecium sonneborni]
MYKGEYKNSKKYGSWDIYYQKQYGNYKNEQIGGGSFDDENLKNGKWIELNKKFSFYNEITFSGEYKHGQKIGAWEIYCCYKENLKDGQWIEKNNQFLMACQVINQGEYLKGKKVGRWDILFRNNSKSLFQLIGGGSYDEKNMKTGIWIQLNDQFHNNFIIHKGEYKNNLKIGRWIIQKIFSNKIIGYGCYDEQQLKQGQWIELSDFYNNCHQITYNGDYLNGKKVGIWDVMNNQDEKKQIITYQRNFRNNILAKSHIQGSNDKYKSISIKMLLLQITIQLNKIWIIKKEQNNSIIQQNLILIMILKKINQFFKIRRKEIQIFLNQYTCLKFQ